MTKLFRVVHLYWVTQVVLVGFGFCVVHFLGGSEEWRQDASFWLVDLPFNIAAMIRTLIGMPWRMWVRVMHPACFMVSLPVSAFSPVILTERSWEESLGALYYLILFVLALPVALHWLFVVRGFFGANKNP